MPMKKTTILIVSLIFVLMIKTPYFGSIFILIINQPSIFKGKCATRKSYVRIQDLKRKKHKGDFQKLVLR